MDKTKDEINNAQNETSYSKSLKDKLDEYGYDSNKNYNKKQMFFINYAIKNFNGLKDKIKASVSLYIVGSITKYIVEENPCYEDLGKYCYDILEDCEVIKLKLPENQD